MTRLATLVILATLAVYVSCDQIVPAAFQAIYPSAAPGKVKTLTTNVNKQTTIEKAKAVLKKWMPNWRQFGITLFDPDNDPKVAAQKKGLTFIDYRYSLRKYINYLYNQAVTTKYLTMAEADTMRTMFWTADKKAANNYTIASQSFLTDASAKIKKTPTLQKKVADLTADFAKAKPKDYANLQWTL